jgi:hypothetical protein
MIRKKPTQPPSGHRGDEAAGESAQVQLRPLLLIIGIILIIAILKLIIDSSGLRGS